MTAIITALPLAAACALLVLGFAFLCDAIEELAEKARNSGRAGR